MFNRTSRACRAAALAGVIGLGTVTGAMPVVISPAAAAEANASTIDATAKGSLTIHKRVGVEPGDRPDGTEKTDVSTLGEGLDGVTYTVQKLDADITTNVGLEKARGLTPTSPTSGELKTVVTNDGGVAKVDNLDPGVYVVKETNAPEGYVTASPFIVFVPMTNPDRTGWNYNVHVYPKNSKLTVDKKVKDKEDGDNGKLLQAGQTLTYTITSDIPAVAGDEGTVDSFKITDTFDSTFFADNGVAVTGVKFSDGTTTTVDALAEETDYTKSVSGGTATIEFDKAGLDKLTTVARSDSTEKKIVVEISATLKDTVSDYELANTATVHTSTDGGEVTDVPSNEVKTYFRNVKIIKTNQEGNENLGGAEFQLHYCTTSGEGDNLTEVISTSNPEPISVGKEGEAAKNTWTTSKEDGEAKGTVTINGIHVIDWANDATHTVDEHYCLVETKAPEGYELLSAPVKLAPVKKLDDGEDTTTVEAIEAPVKNVKTTQPELPLTGGKGIAAILAFGAAVMGAGFLYARRNTRRA